MDCGASTTITGSMVNCTDIAEMETLNDTAKEEKGMTATHSCNKTYFVRNRVGEMVTITTPAIFVKGLPQSIQRTILDEDTDFSGLYPMN